MGLRLEDARRGLAWLALILLVVSVLVFGPGTSPASEQGLEPGGYTVAAITGWTFVGPGREPYRGSVEAVRGELAEVELHQQPGAK